MLSSGACLHLVHATRSHLLSIALVHTLCLSLSESFSFSDSHLSCMLPSRTPLLHISSLSPPSFTLAMHASIAHTSLARSFPFTSLVHTCHACIAQFPLQERGDYADSNKAIPAHSWVTFPTGIPSLYCPPNQSLISASTLTPTSNHVITTAASRRDSVSDTT